MRTATAFAKDLATAQESGIKSRDLLKSLVEDALAFYLADGPSRNDTGRLNMLLTAAENIKAVNTTAIVAWIKQFAPVTIGMDQAGHYVVKHNKKRATDFNYLDETFLTVSFWEFRKKVEKHDFVLDKSIETTIKRWLKFDPDPTDLLQKISHALGVQIRIEPAVVAEAVGEGE